jgi:hypothetical protein
MSPQFPGQRPPENSRFTDARAGADEMTQPAPARGVLGVTIGPYQLLQMVGEGDMGEVWLAEVTAHITGGRTRGCTSWSFQVRDGDRVLNVVSACDLGRLARSQYPEQKADLERSFRVLRGLPVDIWVTCHARWWSRYRKFVVSAAAKDAVEPFMCALLVLLQECFRLVSCSSAPRR